MQDHPTEILARLSSLAQWKEFAAQHSFLFAPGYLEAMVARIREEGFWFDFADEYAAPGQFEIDGDSYRETITFRGLNSRLRAVLSELRRWSIGRQPHELALFAPEAVTPFALYLRSIYPRFIGSEYNEDPAQREALFPILHQDLMALDFPSHVFDFVIANEVFEHLSDLDTALREIRRVLKTGGVVIASFPFAVNEQDSIVRARRQGGRLVHLMEPEYHGDPMSTQGALVFEVPGWSIVQRARYAGFSQSWMSIDVSLRRGILAQHYAGVFLFVAVR